MGSLAVGGLSLGEVLAARAAEGRGTNLETSVILLYLHGGPSQLETYDLKPDAPEKYRSVFRPIPTNVPGIEICEWFPLQAKLADKFALVRSLNHDVNIHSDGGIVVLTGKRPLQLDPTSQSKSEHPDFGSIVSRIRGFNSDAIPPYVAIPQQTYMTRPAYLGNQHRAFEVGNPTVENYAPPTLTLRAANGVQTLTDRKQLLGRLERMRRFADQHGPQTTSEFHDLAFQMLTSSKTAAAFDLALEADDLRDRYGRHLWGQGCLLARRLAEAGTGVISLYHQHA